VADQINRAWSARCQYPDRKPFYLGTVMMPIRSTQAEVDAALHALWHGLSPYPAPELVAVPGIVVFQPEEPAHV